MPLTGSTSFFRWLNERIFYPLAQQIPSNCLLCGTENRHLICSDCATQFFSSFRHRCISCAHVIAIPDPSSFRTADPYCGACLSDPPAFDFTVTTCDYVAPLDQLVLELKFAHRLAVAPILAKQLANAISASALHSNMPDLLIPVPLSRERLARRGFNQALEIAKPLARQINLPLYADLLQRTRETGSQTLLPRSQRRKNILQAFSPNPGYADKIRGSHIGVIDDVMTTGATLHEVAACLKRYGAKRVSNIVFARTPP